MSAKPRIGFLGTGWIGRHRMAAICATGEVDVAAVSDPDDASAAFALQVAPDADRVSSLEALLDQGLDGLVIATPSAAHAAQSIAALERDVAVFCQKPLATSAADAAAVVEAARLADRLLGVDFSYRGTAMVRAARNLMAQGALGQVFAADLTFHNAYGPDKPWFLDRARSGGGCVMDLGCHLIDAALWLLGDQEVISVEADLRRHGLPGTAAEVEDFALATLRLSGGSTVRLACSWNVHAGQDAEIGLRLLGTEGGFTGRNVGGSFYDFEALLCRGTHAERIVSPPDEWGGRMAADWARQLARSPRFDPEAEGLVKVSAAVDAIYAAGLNSRSSTAPSHPLDHASA